MAMTGPGMAAAVVAAIETVDTQMTPAQIAQLTAGWDAICGAIVLYIQTNAVVEVTSVSGVSTGGGVSGPGTGTIE